MKTILLILLIVVILKCLHNFFKSSWTMNVAPDDWKIQCDMKCSLDNTTVRANKESIKKHMKNNK